jgi:sodium-coupled neutral amino acid transporter 11
MPLKDTERQSYGAITSNTVEDFDLLQSSRPGYGTRSPFEVSLNIVNATVGSGVIGLPFALMMAGFTTGIAISVFVSVLTFFAIYSLILTGQKSQIFDFSSLAQVAMGRFGFHMLNLMLFIQSAGSVISYFICKYPFLLLLHLRFSYKYSFHF